MLTYGNQSYNRKDVVGGVPENSPPGQHHHLKIYRQKKVVIVPSPVHLKKIKYIFN